MSGMWQPLIGNSRKDMQPWILLEECPMTPQQPQQETLRCPICLNQMVHPPNSKDWICMNFGCQYVLYVSRPTPSSSAPTQELGESIDNAHVPGILKQAFKDRDAAIRNEAVAPYKQFVEAISHLTICSRKDGFEYRVVPEEYIQEMLESLRTKERDPK